MILNVAEPQSRGREKTLRETTLRECRPASSPGQEVTSSPAKHSPAGARAHAMEQSRSLIPPRCGSELSKYSPQPMRLKQIGYDADQPGIAGRSRRHRRQTLSFCSP
jgi:hypothetical protein